MTYPSSHVYSSAFSFYILIACQPFRNGTHEPFLSLLSLRFYRITGTSANRSTKTEGNRGLGNVACFASPHEQLPLRTSTSLIRVYPRCRNSSRRFCILNSQIQVLPHSSIPITVIVYVFRVISLSVDKRRLLILLPNGISTWWIWGTLKRSFSTLSHSNFIRKYSRTIGWNFNTLTFRNNSTAIE